MHVRIPEQLVQRSLAGLTLPRGAWPQEKTATGKTTREYLQPVAKQHSRFGFMMMSFCWQLLPISDLVAGVILSFVNHKLNPRVVVGQSPVIYFPSLLIRDYSPATPAPSSIPSSFPSPSDDVILVLAYLFPSFFFFLPLSVFSPHPFDSPQRDKLFAVEACLTGAGDGVRRWVLLWQRTDRWPLFRF